jgi:hypothetical protein
MFGLIWHELYGLCVVRFDEQGRRCLRLVHTYYGLSIPDAVQLGSI